MPAQIAVEYLKNTDRDGRRGEIRYILHFDKVRFLETKRKVNLLK